MKSGSADPHDLAVAAKSQADAARVQADNTATIAKAAQSQARASLYQVAKLEAGVKETHALAKAAQESLAAAQENFAKDQAPIIWVSPHDVLMEEGKLLRWDIEFSNFGRSTAFRVRSCVHLEFGRGRGSALGRVQPPSFDTCIPPGNPNIIPPGYKEFTTLTSPVELSAIDVVNAKTIVGVVVATAIFEYEDRSGHVYRSTYCGYRTLGGAIASCPNYVNDIIQLK